MVGCVLITGGGGFIGSHVADELAAHGYRVRVLDDLVGQVHGEGGAWPTYLSAVSEPVRGDVRDPEALRSALRGVDAVIHLAALVGVGQSMYRVQDYVAVNELGTATLLQALIERPVERLIVASSMSVYGEGLYRNPGGALVEDAVRWPENIRREVWDPTDAEGAPLEPLPTPEHKRPSLASIYALSKYCQERMCLLMGDAY